MQDWEKCELEEQIGQAGLPIKKLLETPEDCDLRRVSEGWLNDHLAYMSEDSTGFDVSELDGDPNKLKF